jgi:two-component system, cell cycle sensor histidine kinase and response regulator CckA
LTGGGFQEWCRSVLMGIGDGVIVTDARAQVEFINPAGEALTGWTDREARGKPVEEVFHIVDQQTHEMVQNLVSRVLNDGRMERFSSSVLLVSADGTVRPVTGRVSPIRSDAGEITSVILFFEMIIKYNQIEGTVQKLLEEINSYYDNAPMGLAVFDADLRFLRINNFLAEINGIPAEAHIGKTVNEIVPDFAAQAKKITEEIITTGKPMTDIEFRGETRAHPGGQRTWREGWYPVKDRENRVTGFTVIVQDVTEQNQSEREYLQLFHAMNDTAFVLGFDGRFLAVNEAAVRLLGYSRKELLSTEPGHIDPHFDSEEIRRLTKGMKTDERRVFETEHQTRNGRIIPMEISYSLVTYRGNPAILSVARDISRHKKAESEREKMQEQFLQAQKMESIGRLAGGVAHDYNNMQTVIIGNAQMAMDKISPDDPLYQDLEEILMAARRSADITLQLLTFARRQVINPRVVDLNKTLESILKMLQRLIGEAIDLVWLPASELWKVKVDPSQIDQMLANLCVNARDAISGVGKIAIETRNTVFDEAYCRAHVGFFPGEFVMLAVKDNGCGMEKDILDRVFDPFFTTKNVGKGTGLGLAAVYGIVEQNEGFINVYSKPGHGTTFRVYLPRHGGKTDDAVMEDSEKISESRGETVMLVED